MSRSQATEARTRSRSRTFLAGKIILNDGWSVVDCVVRNLSDTGACLELPSVAGLPDRFGLKVEQGALAAKCRVVWKRGGRIGVAFERPAAPGRPAFGKREGVATPK
jgi:hypothetical protein